MARIDMDKVVTFHLFKNDTDNPDSKLGYFGIYDGSRGMFIGISPKYKDQNPIILFNLGRFSYSWCNQLVDISPTLFNELFAVYEKIVINQETINDLKKEIEAIYVKDLTDTKSKTLIELKMEELKKVPKEHEILNSTLISKDVILNDIKFDLLYKDYLKTKFDFPIFVVEGYEEFELESEIPISKETLLEIKDDLILYKHLNKNFSYSIKHSNSLLVINLTYIFKRNSEDFNKHVDFLTKINNIEESVDEKCYL